MQKIIFSLFLFFIFINATSFQETTAVPPLNQKIIDYVNTVIKKKVDRGECWDLANEALTRINAKWDKKYTYGQLVNPEKDTIYPGDIIQFYGVKMKYKVGKEEYTEEAKHHTAIVYKVKVKGIYDIAHQNTGFSGKKVGISEIDLATVTKGKLKFYRPVSN